MVPKWSGSETEAPLEECFSCIEGAASIGRWEPANQIKVANFKLKGAAELVYIGFPELHAADVVWDKFKESFYQRLRDAHSDQIHFIGLPTASQRKGDRSREL
jgi:hypothetical protein